MTAWVNYDSVVLQLREAGLDVETVEVNTPRPKRVREINGDAERRGWYWLSDIELKDAKGNAAWYVVGAFGMWRGAENIKGKIQLKKSRVDLTAEQKAAIEARITETRKRNQAIRKAEIQKAAGKAQNAWAHYLPEGSSDYLTRKRVGAHGVRFNPDGNGTLIIPMQDPAGRIWGLQIIRAGTSRRKLQKEYWPKGLDKIGHYHLIGQPLASSVMLLAEGYATGATLHEATGLPVAVAFDAGNLLHVAKALRKAYPGIRLLVCADDDYMQKCRECGKPTEVAEDACDQCGDDHGQRNPGIEAAKAAAFAVSGAWVAPAWPFDRARKKITDFNDLANHEQGGQHLVAGQITHALQQQGWDAASAAAPPTSQGGGGSRPAAVSILALDASVERFMPIDDGTGKVLFDSWTKRLVKREQMESLLPPGIRWDNVKSHPIWTRRGSYYLDEVGFDPEGTDHKVKLNTWSGWPTTPSSAGTCKKTLDLLRYLCSAEDKADEIHQWIIKWLALPIQRPGTKMKSALVVHGPQGTGKSFFFEAIADIYDEYGILLNQGAIEDKFNSDWSGRKLFVIADEIVARQDMHHIKNQLKSFITGDWIRVNPKNLPAYRERNHMNIVFLSNEKQPVVLESDDRRHGVIWTPPKLSKDFYDEVHKELCNGGREALHQYLLDVDLTDFHPWTESPLTASKQDLQDLGRGSVEQFVYDWQQLDIDGVDGRVVPFCPCKGAHLYALYKRWCERTGERCFSIQRLLGHLKKLHGWRAGSPENSWKSYQDRTATTRKMVVPSELAMTAAIDHCSTGDQERLHPSRFETRRDWVTRCFFEFADAGGFKDE